MMPATAMVSAAMTASTEQAGRARARRPRIRRRLALIAVIVTGTVMLAFCVPLAFYVRTAAYDRAVDGAELQGRALAAELASIRTRTSAERVVRQANSAASTKATAFVSSGARIGGLVWSRIRIPPGVFAERAVTTVAPDGGRLVWEPVHDPAIAWAVVVRVPPAELSRGVARTWALLFTGGALLVLLAVGLADRLGRSIVRPLQALVTVANRLRDGDLTSRARPAGPYEVAEVALAVNELAGRIDGLLASARLAAVDLGHRLRTPLTALRLDVEALADESATADAARARLKDDLDGLEEAVNQLIQQTRADAGHVPARSDLALAVRDRIAFWEVLAKSQARATDVQLTSNRIDVSLGRDELDAAIDALLSNVFIHTPEGTGFKVILGRPRRGQPLAPW
jgi:signal transduction histidine kinase